MPAILTNPETHDEVDAAPAVTAEDIEAHNKSDPKEEWHEAKSKRARKHHGRALLKKRLRKQQEQAASEEQSA